MDIAGLEDNATVIELGAGTGILTQQLIGKVGNLLAIEPDPYMIRWILDERKEPCGCSVIIACAEAVPLPDHLADAIVVAQAIHWFDPDPTRDQIHRLLKPGGWLVLLKNFGTDERLNQSLMSLNSFNRRTPSINRPETSPSRGVQFFYNNDQFKVCTFSGKLFQGWEGFFGGLLSASFAPEPEEPIYPKYEAAAKAIFNAFAVNGYVETNFMTELIIGKIT